MNKTNFFDKYFEVLSENSKKVNNKQLLLASKLILQVKKKNKKIIVIGNGGSASIASHASIDFTKACGIRCINFNESSLLTCFSNDYGYENWASKALNFYAKPGDLIILISSSGNSKNIINAAKQAKKMKLKMINFSGFNINNKLSKFGDVRFWVNSKKYNVVEIVHSIWILSICDYLIKKK